MKLQKNYHLGTRILAANTNTQTHMQPYKLLFAVTSRCNSACMLCHIWKTKVHKELSTEEIYHFFKKNGNLFSWIDVTGGEIFLREDIGHILSIILSQCKRLHTLHFPTNGLLKKRVLETVKNICAHPQGKHTKIIITVSLDGPRAVHDRLRGIPGNFKKAIETFAALKRLQTQQKQLSVFFGFTQSTYNLHQYIPMYEEIKEQIPYITHDDIHINIAHTSFFYKNTETARFKTETKKQNDTNALLASIQEIQTKKRFKPTPVGVLEHLYLKKSPSYVATGQSPFPCKALASSIMLGPNGSVYPCTSIETSLGNIREQDYDLHTIFATEKAREILHQIQSQQCPMCWTPCEAYQSMLGNIGQCIASFLKQEK